ncbi:MAG: hypothetical protein ACXVRX_12515, partial [Solirubrobacteraceae bacterium]
IVATLIADNVSNGLPAVSGFTDSFLLEAVFLVVAAGAGSLIPGRPGRRRAPREPRELAAGHAAG